jgi:hypothetical protein
MQVPLSDAEHDDSRPEPNPTMKPQLGRLEPVRLRDAWWSEAGDFTPWLAAPDNIVLLGKAIGIELEVESQEKNVGPFRADILCRDTVNGHYVLIENQLERTDHGHLGQLLTYAAGLDAVTIVWVASRFTEEHRAALDWLNNATRAGIDFFGLEIELWRIGDSAMAPKFNVVSKPNDWSKAVREQAAAIKSGQFTESQQRHLEFWTQFRSYLERTGSPVMTNRPSKDHWTNVSVGRTDFSLVLFNNYKDGRSGVYLSITGLDGKAHYRALEEQHRARIDRVLEPLGEVLWRPMPDAKESQVAVRRLVSPADPATWPELNAWMARVLVAAHDLFRPIVKTLDAKAVAFIASPDPLAGHDVEGEPVADPEPDGDDLL